MVETRTYRSPRRALQAAQTRRAVLDAARALFAERGWAATGMRDIAEAAGVAVETIYATIGSKVALLLAALDGAVVGDDEPVPLAEREQFLVMGRGDLAERTAAAAALITDIHVRTIGLQLALREAGAGEPVLAEEVARQEENRKRGTAQGIEMVVRRPLGEHEVDLFWAQTCPEVYSALVHRSGWSTEQYDTWVRSLIDNLEGTS